MRNLYRILFPTLLALLLSGCGFTRRLPSNGDNWNTNVNLGEVNYRIIGKVTGHSKSTYILGIGGMSGRALYSSARADMIKNAELKDNRAIIYSNTTESMSGLPPLFWQNEAVSSGILIEFTDKETDCSDKSECRTAEIPALDSVAVEAPAIAPHDDDAATRTPQQQKTISAASPKQESIDDSYVIYDSKETDDYVIIAKDGKFGIADNHGRIIAKCKYNEVRFILSKTILAKCYTDDSFGCDVIYFDL